MKTLWRNCSIVSALFVVVFAVMLSVNYAGYKKASPLNTPALTAMKEQLDTDPENQLLQQQIREFDLLARKVYFTGKEQVRIGVYILLSASLILIVSLRFLFASYKHLPEKEIDRLDEWAMKTMSRKYVTYGGVGLMAMALVVAFVSQWDMGSSLPKLAVVSDVAYPDEEYGESAVADFSEYVEPETAPDDALSSNGEEQEIAEATDATAEPVAAPVSTVTHNGFRGNNGSAMSAAKNILWKTPTPRQGYNSPVINGNKVFITAADNEARELLCYNLIDGALLWSLKADNIQGSPATPPKTTEDTGLAAPSVAANANVVCAIFGTGDLIASDHSGKRLWAKNLGVPDNHYGHASSLLLYNGVLFVQYDQDVGGKVYAFDAATGAERWSKSRTDKISWASPIIANTGSRSELILMGTPHMTSYNPATGEELWKVRCFNSGEVGSSPAYAGGIIFGANEYATMAAINPQDGSIIWENNDYLPETASTAATPSCVFIATTYGMLICRDAKTGEEIMTHDLYDSFYSSPMIVEGKLYIFDIEGNLYIFTADKECRLLSTVKTGEKTYATPAFTDGRMVVRSDNSIYCVAKM